jgi:AcrR family transcriptional regulator
LRSSHPPCDGARQPPCDGAHQPRRPEEPPSSPPKREAILRAATTLFSRYGFRRASIDLIATEARVAKPTVYAHFADKDALFVAVCERLLDSIVQSAKQALTGPGDLASRLSAALAAKFTTVFEIVGSSPHAAELLESSDTMAAEIVARTDATFEHLLATTVRAAVKHGELDLTEIEHGPRGFIALLMQDGHGAEQGAESSAAHRRNLASHVRVLVRAAKPV